MPNEEFTPRELGLLAGRDWATVTDRELVAQVAQGGLVPQEVVEIFVSAGMRDRLAESDDEEAEEAYWEGFLHGVRAFVGQALAGAVKNN